MSGNILTNREKDVFVLLVSNKSTKEIAQILNISEKTVRNHPKPAQDSIVKFWSNATAFE